MGVMRFGMKEKFSPWYTSHYRISKRIDNVAYELELPQELAAVHLVFQIFMFKKCILSYEELPIQILDRHVHKLRTKKVASVKVLWRKKFVPEDTWESKEDIKKRYPHRFKTGEIPN
ncbi:hypothetical protein EJD97_021496 [Solanum chilense]|uniref:Tf2-1-like SH3-like domain-containing protein n=1 Tax=Solanum chilense TaxID=4083 RepID=A0A6N2AV43_SOLCI|nr:hypothetical protein EJD97_021496 [Solanum chilense]